MTPERFKAYGKGLGLWRDNTPIEPAPPYVSRRFVNVCLAEPENTQEIPTINNQHDRIYSIIHNTPARFKIVDNPNANGSKPFIEMSSFNPIGNGRIYDEMGSKYGLDSGWLKAIAYMENTHGYYDAALPLNNSYRPMNVRYPTWEELATKMGLTEFQVQYRVESNVELGAMIIKRIAARVPNATLEKVASIYNFAGAEVTTDYGARVNQIYKDRLWEK